MNAWRALACWMVVMPVALAARGAVLSVNLNDGTTLTTAQTAGVVPVGQWNNWTDPGNTTTNTRSALVDSNGVTTTASIAIAKSTGDISNGTSGATAATNGDHAMMSQGFGGGGLDPAETHGLYFRVTVPAAFAQDGLRVYFYHWSNLLPGSSGSSRYAGIYQTAVDTDGTGTLGSGSFAKDPDIGDTFARNYDSPVTNFAGTYFNAQAPTAAGAVAGSNYTLVAIPADQLTPSGGNVAFDLRVANVATGVSAADREWLLGIQIEQVPEPSAALLAFGALGGLAARRRRTAGLAGTLS